MRRIIPKNVKVAAMRAYVADGKTLREVASEYGVNSESLRRWLGDKVRPRGSHFKGKASPNPAMRKSTPVVAAVNPRKERVSKHSATYNRANRRWCSEEDEILRDAVLSGMTVKETTELLGRTPVSIYCRKNYLIDKGFINDPETKFVMPTGIKRVRKPLETPIDSIMDRAEAIMSIGKPEVEAVVESPIVEASKASTSNIELSDLAKLVKEFGVNVTVSVTDSGMEVKMTN
jgi:transposase-like protein